MRSAAITAKKIAAARLLWRGVIFWCVAGLCLCGRVGAQSQLRGWYWQNPLPQGNTLRSIGFAKDKKRGWAVGDDGMILCTKDGGYNWEQQETPADTPLNGLFVQDKNRAVAVGANGRVLLTDNGGETWRLRETNVKDHLYAVTFAPDNAKRGWAIGTYGAVVTTEDGGATWAKQWSGIAAHLFAASFIDQKTGFIVGDKGTLVRYGLFTLFGGALLHALSGGTAETD